MNIISFIKKKKKKKKKKATFFFNFEIFFNHKKNKFDKIFDTCYNMIH